MSSLDCSLVDVCAGAWHDGVMLNNEYVLKSIARRVFTDMGKFSSGVAKINSWDAYLSVDDGVAWLTVSLDRDHLFQVEVRGSSVQAVRALPAVIELVDGSREFGTEWADSRRWRVGGWSDILRVSDEIRKFFDNESEYLEEESKVYEILEAAK